MPVVKHLFVFPRDEIIQPFICFSVCVDERRLCVPTTGVAASAVAGDRSGSLKISRRRVGGARLAGNE